MKRILIYDTTLRDGAQGLGISFTVEDKLKIVKKLDELGVSYIEAGNPGSNPKDMEFYERAKRLKLENARLVAFGSTRRANITADEDENVISLLNADTDVVTVFERPGTFRSRYTENNTQGKPMMIADTVSFFRRRARRSYMTRSISLTAIWQREYAITPQSGLAVMTAFAFRYKGRIFL